MKPDHIVLATHNQGKLVELQSMMCAAGLGHITLKNAADYNLSAPEETADSFEGNALIKARFVAEQTGYAALADDSGLCVDGINGDPGVYSADWAGPAKDFDQAFHMIKERLEKNNVAAENASAHFVCVLAYIDETGNTHIFKGTSDGALHFPPRGQNGFGYDPIFVPHGELRSFGEMTMEEKETYSARGRAFAAFAAYLKTL